MTYNPVHLWVLPILSQVKYCFAESPWEQNGLRDPFVLIRCPVSVFPQYLHKILSALHYRSHAWGSIKQVRHLVKCGFITCKWSWMIWKLQDYGGHLYQVHLIVTAESHSQSDTFLPNGCTWLYSVQDILSVKKWRSHIKKITEVAACSVKMSKGYLC